MKLEIKEKPSIDNLQRLDNITSLKLLMHMNEYIEKYKISNIRERHVHENILNADFDYAFNIWLSLDYVDSKGKSMIDAMINEKIGDLTADEINILMVKRESYLSLYKVISQDEYFIELKDVLLEETLILTKNQSIDKFKVNDIFMGRIIQYKNITLSIGDVKLIDEDIVKQVNYSINLKYNFLEKNINKYSKKYYFKKHSYSLYCLVFEAIDLRRKTKLDLLVMNELKEFRTYISLSKGYDTKTLDRYEHCLEDLYKHSVRKHNLTLENLASDMVYKYLIYLCNSKNVAINVLKSYLITFRRFAKYLKEIKRIDEIICNDIIKTCDSREYFQEIYISGKYRGNKNQISFFKEENNVSHFKIYDENLALPNLQNISKPSLLASEFELFINRIKSHELKYKNRKLNFEEMEFEDIKNKKMIMYDDFSRFYDLFYVNYDDQVIFKDKLYEFLNLRNSDKLILFLKFIWFDFNWKKLAETTEKYDEIEFRYRHKYLEHLVELQVNRDYDFDHWRLGIHRDDYKFVNTGFKIYKSKVFIPFIMYWFNDLGLINLKLKEKTSKLEIAYGLDINLLSITDLGREVMYYLILKESQLKLDRKVIKFRNE